MKHALVQGAIVSAPQGAGEAGAVRTEANFVFEHAEVSDVVTSLLGHLAFPAATVVDTSYQLDEFIVADNTSYAASFSDLGGMVGYRSFADEDGGYHFEPPQAAVDYDEAGDPVPVAIFRAGGPCAMYPTALDMVSLQADVDDLELATRVKVIGPMTTLKDAWTETWRSSKVRKPTGIWYDPTDPTHIRVLDGVTRRVYTLLQSSRAITATGAQLPGTYLGGLSGDPADATVYWVLNIPWRAGGSGGNQVLKVRKADDVVLDTYALPSGRWTDLKVDASNLWLSNWDDDKIHKLTKTGTAVASYTIAYDGVNQSNPTGIAIDGTNIYFFFYLPNRILRALTSDPTTILGVTSTAGTKLVAGEMDTDTHTSIFACSDLLGLTWKYALRVAVRHDVAAVVIAGVGAVSPEPLVPTGPLESALANPIRRLILQLPAITSRAQATETALRQLEQVDAFRAVLNLGVLGHPGLQLGDLVQVVDELTTQSGLWIVDTYASEMAETYLGTVALLPWRDDA